MDIRQWIETAKDLPVLSNSIAGILSLTEEDGSDASQIAEVIKRDVSLSASILRIVNSSAFGLLKKITSIDQAVVILGFNSIRNIALGIGVLNLFPTDEQDFLAKTWQRSLATAIAARDLCRFKGSKNREVAFTGGLLHDIGLIAIYRFDPEKAVGLLRAAEINGRTPLQEEERIAGLDHVEAGRLLAEHWELPEEIVYAVMNHHDEPQSDLCSSTYGMLAQVVYLASMVGDIFYFGRKRESIQNFTENGRRLLGITPEDSDLLLQNIHQQLVEIAEYFDISVAPDTTYEGMIRRANEEIVDATVSNEATKFHLNQAFERESKLSAELEETNRKLKKMAMKDGMTGLFNRQCLNELLQKEWSRSSRHGYPLSLVMIDVDNFKSVNDTYGHQCGDDVLKKIAALLTKASRTNDLVARYGGDEFAIILPQTKLNDACMVSERYRSMVQKLSIPFDDGTNIKLTVSCGVSTAFPNRGDMDIGAFIQMADDALYLAKGSGRNKIYSKGLNHNFHGSLHPPSSAL